MKVMLRQVLSDEDDVKHRRNEELSFPLFAVLGSVAQQIRI